MFAELLSQRLTSLVQLSPIQINKLEDHFLLLNKWNRVLNLTSLRDVQEIVERHYCESIFLGIHLPVGNLNIADVGSGPGFPGIPVAVLRPDCSVCLIESHQRKSAFLREATRGLANVHVLARRVEEVSERFDWSVCRAVKFSDIEKSVADISGSVSVLGGKDRPPASRFTWNDPVRLPWGHQRYLWLGIRTRST
ncbi:MAG: 16S rRNA (guanine(527)-N(7))-methyltransferase RsmG [Acidobacteriia bacterium]|nr:16S rRNA (guanine(527)-N(7))-methyltransferase RsmG [Terriglobia bacterium]